MEKPVSCKPLRRHRCGYTYTAV